jgi:hypothetical protein
LFVPICQAVQHAHQKGIVQRYLADEPVEARPPSAGYRLNKFLKRNKGPVIAAGLVLLALLAGVSKRPGAVGEAASFAVR